MSTEVLTSVPGNIWKVLVEVGDEVSEGDVLFIMEVMKSEVNHNAPISGTVIEVNISNDQEGVSPGTVAIVIECCLLYTSPSPRDKRQSRMPSSA